MDEVNYTRDQVIKLLEDCIVEWADYGEQKHPDFKYMMEEYIRNVL